MPDSVPGGKDEGEGEKRDVGELGRREMNRGIEKLRE